MHDCLSTQESDKRPSEMVQYDRRKSRGKVSSIQVMKCHVEEVNVTIVNMGKLVSNFDEASHKIG